MPTQSAGREVGGKKWNLLKIKTGLGVVAQLCIKQIYLDVRQD